MPGRLYRQARPPPAGDLWTGHDFDSQLVLTTQFMCKGNVEVGCILAATRLMKCSLQQRCPTSLSSCKTTKGLPGCRCEPPRLLLPSLRRRRWGRLCLGGSRLLLMMSPSASWPARRATWLAFIPLSFLMLRRREPTVCTRLSCGDHQELQLPSSQMAGTSLEG